MISVIDMPSPAESAWWRGKRGFDVGFFPQTCVATIGKNIVIYMCVCVSICVCLRACVFSFVCIYNNF